MSFSGPIQWYHTQWYHTPISSDGTFNNWHRASFYQEEDERILDIGSGSGDVTTSLLSQVNMF